jgi:hypothetical protein
VGGTAYLFGGTICSIFGGILEEDGTKDTKEGRKKECRVRVGDEDCSIKK